MFWIQQDHYTHKLIAGGAAFTRPRQDQASQKSNMGGGRVRQNAHPAKDLLAAGCRGKRGSFFFLGDMDTGRLPTGVGSLSVYVLLLLVNE